ncbi:MAG: PEP/pyruvate-binding domain-containing protein, partial [Methanomicrobiaceae archaeon]|nr:PEP/pyruvate-binding domain-containing protein [Methanomicrobiaceae archaeon]
MGKVPDIMWLEETRKDDIGSVGGKGASLGEMASIGLPVPKAFTVTAQAFRRFLKETKIEQKLIKTLKDIDVENTDDLERSAQACRELIRNAKMPADIKKEISNAYSKLGKKTIVAVRSSATAEDLPTASFAGQQETFLNVRGESELLESVQQCWASLYTDRAVYYRVKQGFAHEKVDIAVVVQKLIKSEKAGVLFSSHPVTGEPTTIIEASWGLGEAVVSGAVSPDNYVYDLRSGRVVDRKIANKKVEIIPDGDQGTREVEVDAERQNAPVLSDEEVSELAKYGEISEKHYDAPQDIEWGIVGDTIYILQSRPITTIKRREGQMEEKKAGEKGKEQRVLLEGQGASPGIGSGKVVIVKSVKDTGRVKEGDILVAKMTNPDMVPAMRSVSAIITDEGGMTCHAAIVSRELGTPAVVGTKNATNLLKTDQMVTVDGEKGLV